MKRGDFHCYSVTQGGASLALGYCLSPLRGFRFGLLRSQAAERQQRPLPARRIEREGRIRIAAPRRGERHSGASLERTYVS